ncbi:MAG: tetratricopeptide repeat protein [Waterburya sp.]
MSHTIGQVKQDNQQSTSNSNSSQAIQDSPKSEDLSKIAVVSLTDADYEFLFNQLLEGIAHGWHDHRIAKFFNQLGDRGHPKDWIAWLERLRDKVLTLPIQSKRQLGTMMIRLGELTQSTVEVDQIGKVSNRIGRELLFGNTEDVIWEYVGPDLPPKSPAISITMESEQELSERLPTEFAALAASASNERTANLTSEATKDSTDLTTSLASEQELESEASQTTTESSTNLPTADFVSNQEQSEPTTQVSTTQEQPSDFMSTTTSSAEADLSSIPEINDINILASDPVALDLQQIMSLIQEDQELAQQISEKLNVSLVNLDLLASQTAKESSDQELEDLDQSSLELIESWFNLGLKQVSAGEFTKAIASWEKALQINPNLSEAWHNRGSALGRLGQYEEAVDSFQSALVIDPGNYQAWNDRAHALYQLQNWTEAINSWNNAIKLIPGNHLFWYNRGCALEQIEDWDKAIASYEKSLEIQPDFQPARSRYINLVADNSRPN